MKEVLRPGSFVCTIVCDVARGIYVGRVVHQGGLLQLASGTTSEEVERLLHKALAARYQVGTLEPYEEDVTLVTITIDLISHSKSATRGVDASLPSGQLRLSARDMAHNRRQPIPTYLKEVVLVEFIPELQLWYAEDAEGNRYGVDETSEVYVDLELGTEARAMVTAEGFALKLFRLVGQ